MLGDCHAQAEVEPGSTRGGVLPYAPPMRKIALVTSALLFPLFLGCKDETPKNEPGAFGEPCEVGEPDDSPDGCVSGLKCVTGYCDEFCVMPTDCEPVPGWDRICGGGVCNIVCNDAKQCPDTLESPLVCDNAGLYCRRQDGPQG